MQLAEGLGGVRGERGVGAELGHELVVVGVEPLGELERCHRHAGYVAAAGHGEVALQAAIHPRQPEAGRDGAQCDGGVEHVVVEREVVGGHEADPGRGQGAPVVTPDAGRHLEELLGPRAPRPVVLERPLELPVPADARHAVDGRPHALSPAPSSALAAERRESDVTDTACEAAGPSADGAGAAASKWPATASASSRRWK